MVYAFLSLCPLKDFMREIKTESEVEKIKNGANPMSVSLAECEARSTHINVAVINARYVNETAHPCQVIGFQPIPYSLVSNQFCFICKGAQFRQAPEKPFPAYHTPKNSKPKSGLLVYKKPY